MWGIRCLLVGVVLSVYFWGVSGMLMLWGLIIVYLRREFELLLGVSLLCLRLECCVWVVSLGFVLFPLEP